MGFVFPGDAGITFLRCLSTELFVFCTELFALRKKMEDAALCAEMLGINSA